MTATRSSNLSSGMEISFTAHPMSGHDLGGTQLRNPIGCESKDIPQDLICVLPKDRGGRGNRLRSGWKFDWTIHNGDLAQQRVIRLDNHVPGNRLGLRERL